jgi:hypothetical protein
MRLYATRLSATGGYGSMAAPVITGTAFPAETLTSTRAGQWFADGNAISGQTGSTYVVRLSDIGKVITQTGSNALTIWHPRDIAAVKSVHVSLANVFSSISPNVAAANGDPVRRNVDLINGYNADQATSINRPIYRATGQSGGPSMEFVDSNDRLDMTASGSLDMFRDVGYGYIIAGALDTNHTGGSTNHAIAAFTVGSNTTNRLVLMTRGGGGGDNFQVIARRVDGDAFTGAISANNGNYNVLTGEALFATGSLNLRVNGSQTATTALSGGSGTTSNTASLYASIGNFNDLSGPFPGHITAVITVSGSTALSATDRSRLERWVGLMGSLNIPLV